MSQEETLFFLTFIGEYVQVTTSMVTKEHIETEEGTIVSEGAVSIIGYLLDEDDKYYYLGPHPDGITDAVKKSSVRHIKIMELKSNLDSALDDMIAPKNSTEIN